MNTKLLALAVAVAGALAAPGVALAQSSVTISGLFKISIGNYKIGSTLPARTGNTSESRMTDDSSRIVFNVVEDLGGGLSAIGQVDWRVALDNGVDAGGPTGNVHVGLNSKQWGQIRIGRQDLHYFNTESNMVIRNDLKAVATTMLSVIQNGTCTAAGVCSQVAIGNNTRTPNVVWYRTPNYGGFDVIVAYSFNPVAAQEADIGAVARKGRGWNLQPNFKGRNFQVGYSYLSAKQDALAGPDQRGDRLYGSYDWGGFHVGLAWDRSKLTSATTGVITNKRTAWSLPVEYKTGPHNILFHYTKARDDKDTAVQDGARMVASGYAYDLSKRTSLATTYASIRNDVGAGYNLFAVSSAAIGTGGTVAAGAGEDPRLWSVTLRHVF